jgi:hypothetical protein
VRLVVSGTHASGKSTLVSDLALARHGYDRLPDPFELVDDDIEPAGVESFVRQLEVTAERLVELPQGCDVVAERGPLDFLAYLAALGDLGRRTVAPSLLATLRAATAEAMGHVDVLVVLPLESPDPIRVPAEEDPELRAATDDRLLELCDDDDLVGPATRVVALTGTPEQRLTGLLTALDHPSNRP